MLIGRLLDLGGRAARQRAQELLAWFDLLDAADRPAKTYSGGMRRRLDLAASLVGRPAVVFLDEPTTGLDPTKREDMWGVVRRLVADGSTVLLTTQYLDEADALADEITVIDHGRVIAHDTPDGLKRVVGGQTLTVRPADPSRLAETAAIVGELARRAGRLRDPRDGQRAGRRRRAAGRGGHPARRRRHRRHRALPAAAEPRRGLLHAHRPTDRQRARGGARMIRLARHSLALAQRNLIGVVRNPEALIDVTLQPIIFIALFTFVFGGAIAHGSQHDYLQFLLPGILAQTIAFGGVAIGVNLNTDIEKGVFDRFRSLPIARAAPLVGAVLGDVVRYVLLCVVTLGFGYVLGFRAETGAARGARRLRAGDRLRAVPVLGVGVRRHDRPHAGRGAGHPRARAVPADLRDEHVRARLDAAGLAADGDEVNPLTHLVGALRGLMLGGPVANDVLWTLGWMGVLLAVFVPLALRAYRRRA